MFSAILYAKD